MAAGRLRDGGRTVRPRGARACGRMHRTRNGPCACPKRPRAMRRPRADSILEVEARPQLITHSARPVPGMPAQPLSQAIELSKAGRNDEAVEIIRQVALTGDPDGLCMLAEMTWRGGMVDQDPVRARVLYEYAATFGHQAAAQISTNLLASGIAGKREWSTALLRLAAEADKYPQRSAALQLIRGMDLDRAGNPKTVPAGVTLSEHPYIRQFRAALTRDECDYLCRICKEDFRPSMVYTKAGYLVLDEIRTSDGAAVHWLIEDPAIHALNRRISAITDTDYEAGEALQVLRYLPGQQYRPHFDFVPGAANPRLWTALIYLNDAYEGGETAFVRTDLRVRGRTGDVLVFANAAEDGSQDRLAQHAGLPVTSGTKYLATRWIRERRWIP